MRVRLRTGVRLRADDFGGICYVSHRDDFFAANSQTYALLATLTPEWAIFNQSTQKAYRSLARLGICETDNPATTEIAYSGPSFLGEFPEIPSVSEPLVLNCFCTSHCPLKCVYCHADDLMGPYRETERDADIENVAATANMVPAMVAVITGGDPLTRPDRAKFLIEKLASQKSIVLDTSGAGDIASLIPILVKFNVHVRVSLDAISEANDKLRPGNRDYGFGRDASRRGAEVTILACIEAGVPVTVQTVVSSQNENEDEWRDLRDWLVARAVKNWVLHVCVKGGSARRIENAARKNARPRGILPSDEVYSKLWRLISETERQQLPLDVRCTDTDTTPNSVLLVGSTGDLFTEGYAHNGKVSLYRSGQGRPDLIRKLWPHVDRFGHARRYLNWNPWFFNGKSLDEICYRVPIPKSVEEENVSLVETEAKYHVTHVDRLSQLLGVLGYIAGEIKWQRDEYYDDTSRSMASLDYVLRLRKEIGSLMVAFKGPRGYTGLGESSRIELEVNAGEENLVRADLARHGLASTWFFEKRRRRYTRNGQVAVVFVDEVPEIGWFVEIEGPLGEGREIAKQLASALGVVETRNYRDLFIDFKVSQGLRRPDVCGASFEMKSPPPRTDEIERETEA